jgi:hypothetical protein
VVENEGVGTFYMTSDTSGKTRRGKWNSDWKENRNYFVSRLDNLKKKQIAYKIKFRMKDDSYTIMCDKN